MCINFVPFNRVPILIIKFLLIFSGFGIGVFIVFITSFLLRISNTEKVTSNADGVLLARKRPTTTTTTKTRTATAAALPLGCCCSCCCCSWQYVFFIN